MKIDDIISLDDGTNYLLLELLSYDSDKYFFAVKVNDEKNKALGIYEFIKIISDSDKEIVKLVDDKNLKETLYGLLTSKFNNESE